MGPIIGLDVGDRRIGVAISDPEGRLAFPVTIIERRGEPADEEAILELARQREVTAIVVGIPRSLSGELGPQAEKVQAFVGSLARMALVPVVEWDERLSTVAAERAMREAGLKAGRRKARRDAVAAAFILQGYLDSLRPGGTA